MIDTFRALGNSLFSKILLAFLVLTFAVWGIEDMIRQPARQHSVADVGGRSISTTLFTRTMREETERMRGLLGDQYSVELLKSLNLPQQVLQQLISRTLLEMEGEAMGLLPGDEDVAKNIRKDRRFQDKNGRFDKTAFSVFLRNTGQSEKLYVEELRRNMAAAILAEVLLKSMPVHAQAAPTLLAAREEQREVHIYTLKSSLVPQMEAPSDTQIKQYYDAHARDFTTQEYRTVSYATITPTDAQNAPISEAALKQAYEDRLDEFRKAERRSVEQMLFANEEDAKKADALLKEGKNFSDVAKTSKVTNKDSLSLGKVERSALIENAADTVFSLPSGGSTAPIKSPFGWHIFHVSAIHAPSVAPLEEVRSALEKDMKQHAAADAQSQIANRLEDALAGGDSLAEAAEELKLKVRKAGPISRQGESPDGKAKDVPELDKFLETAFKTDDKGDSPVMTAKGSVYYILHVDNVTPERQRPLEEVRGQAVAGWQKEERIKRLGELAQTIAGKFQKAAEREALIGTYGLEEPLTATIKRSSRTADALTLPPGFAADVFSQKPGGSTQPYALPSGEYVIGIAESIIPAVISDKDPKTKSALSDLKRNLTTQAQNELLEEYTRSLKKKYPVSINETAIEAALR